MNANVANVHTADVLQTVRDAQQVLLLQQRGMAAKKAGKRPVQAAWLPRRADGSHVDVADYRIWPKNINKRPFGITL